ncbi:hypothetical protein MMC29_001258 [Sticta canariensis]|nr:hypothetical protein [Sticta canariensis]
MDPGHPTPVKEDHEDQDAAPKAVRRTSTGGRRIKHTDGPSVLGAEHTEHANPETQGSRTRASLPNFGRHPAEQHFTALETSRDEASQDKASQDKASQDKASAYQD